MPRLVRERDPVARRRRVDGEADRQRPRQAALRGASPRPRARSRPRPMKPSSGESAPEASMSRSDSSREVERDLLERRRRRPAARPCGRRASPPCGRDQVIRPVGDGRHAVHRRRDEPQLLELRDDELRALLRLVLLGVERRARGRDGSSYGSSTPVKPVISPRERLLVQALHVAAGALLDRRRTYTSTNVAPLLDHLARLPPRLLVRRDRGRDHRPALARQARGDPADRARCSCRGPPSRTRAPSTGACRTVSPSRYSTTRPRRSSSGPTRWAIVDLPEPDSPVNQSVKPPSRRCSDSGCSCA